jgi:ATP-independent RNA helicase DbpA
MERKIIVSTSAFTDLTLKPSLLNNLSSLGYTQMTPIQAQSLPIMLQGKDVIAQGETGSGKTAAFGLTLLNKLDSNQAKTQALVLSLIPI